MTCARVPLRRIDRRMIRVLMKLSHLIVTAWLIAFAIATPAHADAAFETWLQSLWPEAQKLGVSRATFDTAARGLEPDLSLPGLAVPRPGQPPPRPAAPRAGRVRADAGGLSQGFVIRSPRHPGAQAARAAPRHPHAHRAG